MSYTLIRGSSYQIWWQYSISKQFDLWLTLVDPCMTFDPQRCITLWSGILPTKFGGHRALLSILTPTWPSLPRHDLWPQQCITLWTGILPTKFGGHRAFLSNLTPGWPWMTPAQPLTLAMHYPLVRGSSHQIWWPKGIASKLIPTWPQLTPTWPLTPVMLYALVRDSPTKFGGHRVFLSNLTPGRPQMTPAWPLTPAMHYILVKGFFTKFGSHRAFMKVDWPLDDLWPQVGSLQKHAHKPRGPIPYPHANFQLDASKHDQTHSRTYIHTDAIILVV